MSCWYHGKARLLPLVQKSLTRTPLLMPRSEPILWLRSISSSESLQQKQPLFSQQLLQQVRYKHAAKMGQHLETLDDMAHDKEREQARERRKKQKDKKAARKGKHKNEAAEEDSSSKSKKFMDAMHGNSEEEDYDDDDHDDDHEDDQDVLPDPDVVKERMKKVVDKFTETLKAIRGAEPTPELFDEIMVQAYGSSTSLKSVAQVVIASPTLASATCFDPAVAKDVANALRTSMGLNPSIEDGGVVRIPIPRASMESRQKTAALLGKRTESFRQKIRKVRRKALDIVKPGVAGKLEGVSKDDAFRVQKEIEHVTEIAIGKLNEISEKKHDSVMAV